VRTVAPQQRNVETAFTTFVLDAPPFLLPSNRSDWLAGDRYGMITEALTHYGFIDRYDHSATPLNVYSIPE
jgi:hypothetical protein